MTALGVLAAVMPIHGSTDAEVDAEIIQCRPKRNPGCGGVRMIEQISNRPELDNYTSMLELQTLLIRYPEMDRYAWSSLTQGMADLAEVWEKIEAQYQTAHWRPFVGAHGLDPRSRLEWLHRRTDAHPDDQLAWQQWAEAHLELFGAESLLADLNNALAQHPQIPAIRQALFEHLDLDRDGKEMPWAKLQTIPSFEIPELWDPNLRRLAPLLPPTLLRQISTRQRQFDFEGTMFLLQAFGEHNPGLLSKHPELQVEILSWLRIAELEEDLDFPTALAELERMATLDYPLLTSHRICETLVRTGAEDESVDDCRARLLSRARTAGLNREDASPSSVDEPLGDPDLEFDQQSWNELITDLQRDRLRQAIFHLDTDAMEAALVHRPDIGSAADWLDTVRIVKQAIHRAEPETEDPAVYVPYQDLELVTDLANREPQDLKRFLTEVCALFFNADRQGRLEAHVVAGANACPQRLDQMTTALGLCGLQEIGERLGQRIAEHLPTLSLESLMALELPVPNKILELERRLTETQTAYEADRLHRHLAHLRIAHRKESELWAKGIRTDLEHQLQRWAQLDPLLLRTWLRGGDVPQDVVSMAARSLVAVEPHSTELHLRVAFDALFVDRPARPEIARQHAETALRRRHADRRQQAEAHYLLGHAALADMERPSVNTTTVLF